MAIPDYSMTTALQFAGRELGTSDWVAIDQQRIDQFATCTGDRQWIHVDVERAARESPFGGLVAHDRHSCGVERLCEEEISGAALATR